MQIFDQSNSHFKIFQNRCSYKSQAYSIHPNKPTESSYRRAKELTNLLSGTLKLEVYTCVYEKFNHYGFIGGVIRDHRGRYIYGFGRCTQAPPHFFIEVKLNGIHKGLAFANARGLRSLLAFFVSFTYVQEIMDGDENLHYTEAKILQICKLLDKTHTIALVHIKHTTKFVSHHMTYFISSSPSPLVWENGN